MANEADSGADEPTTDETPDEEERQRFADRVLSVLEDAVYWAIAVLLVAGSVALLVAQVNTFLTLRATAASTVADLLLSVRPLIDA